MFGIKFGINAHVANSEAFIIYLRFGINNLIVLDQLETKRFMVKIRGKGSYRVHIGFV